jgi:hypothetical protein
MGSEMKSADFPPQLFLNFLKPKSNLDFRITSVPNLFSRYESIITMQHLAIHVAFLLYTIAPTLPKVHQLVSPFQSY